jgi:endonuclease YncB( thermonuclease family)
LEQTLRSAAERDEDTLKCGRERVRVQGVCAPELNEPGGYEAKQRLQQRIDSASLRIERHRRDKYGRT